MLNPGHRRWLSGALAAVVMLLGAGCSEDGNDSPARSSQAPSSEGGEGAGEEGGASDAEVTGTIPDVGDPVATRTVVQDGNTLRLDVFPLVFDEGSTGVSVNVRLVFEEMAAPTARPGLLASPEDQGSVRMRRASGLQVIDRKGGTAYLPARDAEGTPLCSPEVPIEASTGDQVYITCVFGGLDEDVEALDLVVPSFGTFRDVSSQ